MNRKQKRAAQKKKGHSVTKNTQAVASFKKDLDAAKTMLERNDIAGSTQILKELLRQDPKNVTVLELLGVASANLKNYDAAESFFNAAKAFAPNNKTPDVQLGRTYAKKGEFAKAIPLLENNISHIKKNMTESTLSDCYLDLFNAYLFTGDKDKARTYALKACDASKNEVRHLYNLFSYAYKPKDENDKHLKNLKRLEKERQGDMSIRDKSLMYYALFKAHQDLEKYDEAFENVKKASAYRRSEFKFDLPTAQRYFKSVKEYFDKAFFDEHEETRKKQSDDGPHPVFICGMPRSGTTLLEQIIQAHPEADSVSEDRQLLELIKNHTMLPDRNGHAYPLAEHNRPGTKHTLEQVNRAYKRYLYERTSQSTMVVNKSISNIFSFPMSWAMFPEGKHIHIKRNPVDCCVSCFTHSFQEDGHHYTYDLEELGAYYHEHVLLMEHWKSIRPDDLLIVEYENIVRNPEEEVRRILNFLELPWNDACLEFYKNKSTVYTASTTQVRQPLYKSAMGRWKKYSKHLVPLIKALGPSAPQDAKDYLDEHTGANL